MWRCLCVLLAVAGAFADEAEERRSKLPFIADAVGNTLPPPSNGPATVGSPSNLLTPDRYEFYTFDDSGELVKRLMTLEEIQAIVAAGEGTDGHLVTFANDDQPPIAFNFSQAPFTKVHSVVTNVQNVLKAQMEAQKNNPPIHALDTPDVSDSWSLILPTIFGNTGADIIPDKSSTAHTVPETEMVEIPNPTFTDNDDFSKESNNNILNEPTKKPVEQKITEQTTVTDKPQTIYVTKMSSTTTTTTLRPRSSTSTTTTTTTQRPRFSTSTTTSRPRITSTKAATRKPSSSTTTTQKPLSTTTTTTTTLRPRATTNTITTTTTTTPRPRATTTTTTTTTTTPRPRTTSSSTTFRPRTTTTVKPIVKSTTAAPKYTTTNQFTKKQPTASSTKLNSVQTEKSTQNTNTSPSTFDDEKTNNFIPVSTVTRGTTEKYSEIITEATRTTPTFSSTSKRYVTMSRTTTTTAMPSTTKVHPVVTTYKPTTVANEVSSTAKEQEFERIDNATTITTQSVSPSTTVSSTEFMSVESKPSQPTKANEDAPLSFDVALSMSQIASDLGNPNPTSSNIVNINKVNDIDVESKESLEIDIPTETKNSSDPKIFSVPALETTTTPGNFVKISTIDPVFQSEKNATAMEMPVTENKMLYSSSTEEPSSNSGTTIDPILFESMDDLLSQVVHQQPTILQSTENPAQQKTTNEASTKKAEVTTQNNKIKVVPSAVKKPVNKVKDTIQEKPSNDIDLLQEKIESPFQDDKEINKEDMNKTFVQVSTTSNDVQSSTRSPVKTDSINVSNQVKEKPSIVTEKVLVNENVNTSEQVKIDQTKLEHNEKEELAFQEVKQELESVISSTQSSTTTSKQEILIEQTTTESNKITTTDSALNENKDKTYTEISPKIDEFKKKIQKVNIDDKELVNERNSSWKLISTVTPPKANEIPNDKLKVDNHLTPESDEAHKDINLEVSKENQGLEVTTKDLNEDITLFTDMCNELAFRYWNEIIEHIDKKRSFVLSPYSITSMLAMMFMGARGATSGEMNDILKLDDMVTFNPHFTLKNISDSIDSTPESGVVVSAFVRELYSDRNIGKILTFYKERAQHFYSGHVEEVNFKLISDIIRRRTNLLVKRHTWGKIAEYMKTNSITMQPPLAAFSTNIFQTDCSGSSVDGRDGEMYFVVSPTVRQRRLVPVPAVVYRKGFLAGYDPVLDATAAAIGNINSVVSTLFLMPGQQGNVVHAEDLEALEKRLLDSNPTMSTWNRLLRTLLPRMGLELQIPRFSHKSIFNVSDTLKKMGLKDLFDAEHADLGGLIGPSKDLHLSDMIQLTTFTTCGEGVIADQHHIEEYPDRLEGTRRRRTSRWTNAWDEPRDYQRAFHDPHDVGDAMHLPLHLRPRQARLPARNAQPARLKFDRPFLFFVRHNPTGMILYVGRYNPRLLP